MLVFVLTTFTSRNNELVINYYLIITTYTSRNYEIVSRNYDLGVLVFCFINFISRNYELVCRNYDLVSGNYNLCKS